MSDATVPNEKPLGFIDAEPAQPVAPSNDSTNEDAVASRSDRARHAAYHSRFVGVYIALALVAGVGVGALVASIMRDDNPPAAKVIGQFTPSKAGELGAIELARSVEQKYRLADGQELTAVIASRNTLQDGQGGFFRVRFQLVEPFDATGNRDNKPIAPEHAIQYTLCGANAQCAIPGTATPTRFGLLQRQGLELAVRTFQNDSSVDNVVVFLGPVQSPDPSWMGYTMMFDRAELNRNEPGLLGRPLGETLPGDPKTITPSQLEPAQMKKIDALTRAYTYLYRYQILGGRDALLQLQPAKR